jgi:hypothetical protein
MWLNFGVHLDPGIIVRKWSGRVDLNHRPPGPEPGALARLRYAPTVRTRARIERAEWKIQNSIAVHRSLERAPNAELACPIAANGGAEWMSARAVL